MVSCFEKEETVDIAELRKQEMREARAAARAERKAEKLAALKLEQEQAELETLRLKEEEMAALAKLQAEAEMNALAAKKEKERQAEIAARQMEQKIACNRYIGTQYDEFKLKSGRVLKSVSVSAANATTVSFMHSGGVATVKYDDLPEEIGVACKYDPELEQIMLEEERKNKKKFSNSSQLSSSNQVRKTNYKKSTNSSKQSAPKKAVIPRGNIVVKVVGVRYGNKDIKVTGVANVDSTLYLEDYTYRIRRSYSIKANEKFAHSWKA